MDTDIDYARIKTESDVIKKPIPARNRGNEIPQSDLNNGVNIVTVNAVGKVPAIPIDVNYTPPG